MAKKKCVVVRFTDIDGKEQELRLQVGDSINMPLPLVVEASLGRKSAKISLEKSAKLKIIGVENA